MIQPESTDDELPPEPEPKAVPRWAAYIAAGMFWLAGIVLLTLSIAFGAMSGFSEPSIAMMAVAGTLEGAALMAGGARATKAATWSGFLAALGIAVGIALLLFGMCMGGMYASVPRP